MKVEIKIRIINYITYLPLHSFIFFFFLFSKFFIILQYILNFEKERLVLYFKSYRFFFLSVY